jgi:Secretion system C-terminal sorting domain
MKTYSLLFLFALHVLSEEGAYCQISIVSSQLPQANDSLITQPATLLVDVDLELSGADYQWDFGPDVLSITPTATGLHCYDVNDTPLAYQFLFNNPFLYPVHNSDYGLGVAAFDVATISFEDTYMYYKNSNNKFSITGMGASINGIPLAAQKIEPELLFNTPLDYLDADSSYSEMEFTVPGFGFYGQNVSRSYACDGWGVLTIADQNFEVLRIRSEVAGTDSLFSETFNFGFMIPRPASIEYTWYTPTFKVPLLQVITSDGLVTSVTTAPLQLPSAVSEKFDSIRSAFPNPADQMLTIPASAQLRAIYDVTGRKISDLQPGISHTLSTSTWPAGIYTIGSAADAVIEKIVIQH